MDDTPDPMPEVSSARKAAEKIYHWTTHRLMNDTSVITDAERLDAYAGIIARHMQEESDRREILESALTKACGKLDECKAILGMVL